MISIHPHEATLQQAKARQRDPAWQQAYRTPAHVERKISHYVRRPWGGRKARCRGQARILTDVLARASAINLARLATLGCTRPRLGYRLTGTDQRQTATDLYALRTASHTLKRRRTRSNSSQRKAYISGVLGGRCQTAVRGRRLMLQRWWSLLRCRGCAPISQLGVERWLPLAVRGWRRGERFACRVRLSASCAAHRVAVAHPDPGTLATASAARRARLTAAASRAKSAAILVVPRTRARRPPWRRRIRWAILRSTLGRVAR